MSSEINEFPSIQGNNLNKVKKIVPDDFVDRDLIVIVAFQQWHQPLVDESIENLEKDKNNIENELGEKLDWQLLPHRAASRIKLARKNSILDNQKDWDEYIIWLIEKLEKFYHVFSKRLSNMN